MKYLFTVLVSLIFLGWAGQSFADSFVNPSGVTVTYDAKAWALYKADHRKAMEAEKDGLTPQAEKYYAECAKEAPFTDGQAWGYYNAYRMIALQVSEDGKFVANDLTEQEVANASEYITKCKAAIAKGLTGKVDRLQALVDKAEKNLAQYEVAPVTVQ